MTVRSLLRMGDSRLLEPARPVEDLSDPGLHELIGDLFDTMRAAGGVGLAAPHLATLLVGPRPGARLAATLLCGGVLCGLADVLGRTLLAPLEIPLGLMTAALGAPYLLCLLAYQGRSRA